jgi:DNA repair exonuclease SbcCD ATPase subunit
MSRGADWTEDEIREMIYGVEDRQRDEIVTEYARVKRERDTAITELVRMRGFVGDASKLVKKYASVMEERDRVKAEAIEKYADHNPLQSLKGQNNLRESIDDVLQSLFAKISRELTEAANANRVDNFLNSLDSLWDDVASEMIHKLEAINLNHFVVKRESIESEPAASLPKQKAPQNNAALTTQIDVLKRNLNAAIGLADDDHSDLEFNEIEVTANKLEHLRFDRPHEDEVPPSFNYNPNNDAIEQENKALKKQLAELQKGAKTTTRAQENINREVDKLKEANQLLKNRIMELERELKEDKRYAVDEDSPRHGRGLDASPNDMHRDQIYNEARDEFIRELEDKEERIAALTKELQIYKDDKKRLLLQIDKLKRDLARALEQKDMNTTVSKIIDSATSSLNLTQHRRTSMIRSWRTTLNKGFIVL